jgi:rhamnosyltransferase
METSMVAAIIVLYHPDLALLDRLVTSILGQVEMIYVVDNTPEPSATIVTFLNQLAAPIAYRPLGDNMGIAYAQNVGIREALQGKCTHVLLLDQDSALSTGMINLLLSAEASLIAQGNKIAAVGPVFIDEKTGKSSPATRCGALRVRHIPIDLSTSEPVEADYIIASGSLIQRSTFDAIGLMREELFIDWVDIEWGLRARNAGYKSYLVPTAILQHSIGDATVKIFGKVINVHSDIRHYYIVRNAAYLIQLKTMGWRWRMLTTLKLPRYVLAFSWFSQNRMKSLRLLSRALIHGLEARTGRFEL